jgi:hypothetical protein
MYGTDRAVCKARSDAEQSTLTTREAEFSVVRLGSAVGSRKSAFARPLMSQAAYQNAHPPGARPTESSLDMARASGDDEALIAGAWRDGMRKKETLSK